MATHSSILFFFFYSLQYSCLEIFVDGGAWQDTVQGFTKSWTQLSTLIAYVMKMALFTFMVIFSKTHNRSLIMRKKKEYWSGLPFLTPEAISMTSLFTLNLITWVTVFVKFICCKITLLQHCSLYRRN